MEQEPTPEPEPLDADEIIRKHQSGQHGLPIGAIRLLLVLEYLDKE